ncbi:hypothetical protein AA0115_g9842 [Alternaria tenuissima]|uniref:DDE-1 domain-containing protein n=1 Tax=Alternaria tenuissima TaxID=119927 RepID=A0AB37WAZ7_9PLEO|nr:hypothetical protein AA0115_g9842 [Alternaria tenuissima]
MDETGIAIGVCNNTRVLASTHKRKAYVKSPENREWITIVECVSADGRTLRPLVIFKGQRVLTSWFDRAILDWLYTTSDNGWTSNSTGLEWLQRVFIAETSCTPLRNRLLILDGHGSYDNIDFMWECYQQRIHVLYLPGHSSHILQPLDLSPFGAVKKSYRQQVRALAAISDAAPVRKQHFIGLYYKARQRGLSERVIRAGWRASGIAPYNPELVLQSSQLQTRPATPPPRAQPTYSGETVITTPRRSQDLYKQQQQLGQSEQLSRATRVLLSKAGKALAAANTLNAALYTDNLKLQHQANQLKIKKPKKRVHLEPNKRFVNVEAIKAAMDAAAASAAQKTRKQTREAAQKAPTQSYDIPYSSMCNQWQL